MTYRAPDPHQHGLGPLDVMTIVIVVLLLLLCAGVTR